jgi:hypothetical protein
MSFGTRFAFPYDNVPLDSASLQKALLFLLSQGQALFASFTVSACLNSTLTSKRNANGLKIENKYKQA